MFDRLEIKRLKPILLFLLTYTAIFFLFAYTLKYTFPFLAGFLLAMLIQPVIRFFKNRLRCKPGLASAFATILIFIVLFGLLFLFGFWLVYEIKNLINGISTTDFANITSPINQIMEKLGDYFAKIDGKFISDNQDKILDFAKNSAGILTTILSAALSFLTSIPTIFTMFIVMIFSTYFFSKDIPNIKSKCMSLFSKTAVSHIRNASHHSASMSGKYISSYLLIYFITFVETLLVFAALGIPYPLVLSIITGIADILPVFGPGTIYLPLSVLYLIRGDFFHAAALLIGWLVITAIRQVIEPKIVSSSINIHPLSMLAAIYFALIAANIWVLIYFSVLFILYQILRKVEVLPSLFVENETIKPKTDQTVSINKNDPPQT